MNLESQLRFACLDRGFWRLILVGKFNGNFNELLEINYGLAKD